jgi:hypothetical protein
MNIKFQTSSLVPAPYAYAIQLDLNENKDRSLSYNLELEYLDRDQLTEEEILDEGFTLSDDIKLEGKLPQTWAEELKILLSKTERTDKTELEDSEDFWFLEIDKDQFYPKNVRQWAAFLEQIRQAILENNELEKPLEITFVEISNKEKSTTVFKGSFTKRTLIVETGDGQKENLKWSQLSAFLKDIFSGDFDYENATSKPKNADGIYINLGDEFWFEVGKSYTNHPKKIKNWL